MKGLDKLTPIRLAEVLSQKALVAADAIADALYAHDKHRESFTEILVSGGHITEWDLAKVVVEHFQLPFIMSGGYDVVDAVKSRVPKELLFANLIVPLDVFDDILTIAMPIMVPFDTLKAIQTDHNLTIYPYVGLPSENKSVLTAMFPEFKEWAVNAQKELDAKRKKKAKREAGENSDWTSLFDSADAAVRGSLKK